MGNCGVGFAPAAPDRHDWLINLMEGVEDIPGSALAAGMRWSWESFPEYLDAVDRAPKLLDVAAQVPHGPVRTYVMGDRGAGNEPPTADDIDAMRRIVREALEAGAIGVTSAHTLILKSADGAYVPGATAAEDEMLAIAEPLGELDRGVFEVNPAGVAGIAGEDIAADPDSEMAWMRRVSAQTGRPITFPLLQNSGDPTYWQRVLDFCDEATADGAQLYPQVHARSPGVLLGLQNIHPFLHTEGFQSLAALPLDEKVDRMRDEALRRQILDQVATAHQDIPSVAISRADLSMVFPLREPLDYEQPREATIQSVAEREGRNPLETFYDLLLEDGGKRLFYVPFLNYVDYNYDAVGRMLRHPRSIFGLGDAGAHCGVMIDASLQTFLLSHWCRDRSRGDLLPIELAVKKMTSETADLWGLHDRGRLQPGMKADVNLIDFDNLKLHMPEFWYDLPYDARRLVQRADGYAATIVSGQVIMRNGQPTGARPGALIRGEQPAPI
jgi:N-acyl-D-aspartate/D-glutamate deacylase